MCFLSTIKSVQQQHRNLTTSVSPGDTIDLLCWIGRSECAVSVRNHAIRHTSQCCQSSKKKHLISSGPQEQTCIKRSQRCTRKGVHTRQKTTRILPQWKIGSKSFCLLILNGSTSHSWHIISSLSAMLFSVIATITQIQREILLYSQMHFIGIQTEHQMRIQLIDLNRAAHNTEMKLRLLTQIMEPLSPP